MEVRLKRDDLAKGPMNTGAPMVESYGDALLGHAAGCKAVAEEALGLANAVHAKLFSPRPFPAKLAPGKDEAPQGLIPGAISVVTGTTSILSEAVEILKEILSRT